MNEVRYDLRLPTTSELAELTRLYASTFGEQAATQWRARWEWQFARGPAADRSDYCVASLNGAAVGQYALMPVTLWWSDREARAAFGTDAFLAPTVRGRGAGKQLYDTANHAGFDVCLGAGITIDSLRVLQRLEWTDMKTIPMLARRTSWRRHLSLAGLRQLVSRSRTKPGARDVDVHIAKTSTIGTEFDELWRACRSGFALCVRRDAAYLRWRYQDVPGKAHTVWEARRGARLVGFAISCLEPPGVVRVGVIDDVFTEHTDDRARDALLAAVLQDFRSRADLVIAGALHDGLRASLKRNGFTNWRPEYRLFVKVHSVNKRPLESVGRWHITLGDGDLDVPR